MRNLHIFFAVALGFASSTALAQAAGSGACSPGNEMSGGSCKPIRGKKTCGKGKLGGIVATNKKVGKEVVTTIRGDKQALRTPESAGEAYLAVSKLKPGELYCYSDDGS